MRALSFEMTPFSEDEVPSVKVFLYVTFNGSAVTKSTNQLTRRPSSRSKDVARLDKKWQKGLLRRVATHHVPQSPKVSGVMLFRASFKSGIIKFFRTMFSS